MKKAFTLLELIFVIVVIGIISTIALPRLGGGELRKATDQVVSHIRYTQHLAMVDDKFDSNNTDWFKARWQIYFQLDNFVNGHNVYSIYTDRNLNDAANPSGDELALDPLTKRRMSGNSLFNPNRVENMNLTEQYDVSNIDTTGCANTQRIFFDHMGRPHINNNSLYGDLLTTECRIVIVNSEGNRTITINPETGYVFISE